MVMGSSDDLSMKCMVSWNINSVIVPNETVIHFHAAIMVEGTGDDVIPEMNVLGGSFYAPMGFLNGWHDHGSEVLWG